MPHSRCFYSLPCLVRIYITRSICFLLCSNRRPRLDLPETFPMRNFNCFIPGAWYVFFVSWFFNSINHFWVFLIYWLELISYTIFASLLFCNDWTSYTLSVFILLFFLSFPNCCLYFYQCLYSRIASQYFKLFTCSIIWRCIRMLHSFILFGNMYFLNFVCTIYLYLFSFIY